MFLANIMKAAFLLLLICIANGNTKVQPGPENQAACIADAVKNLQLTETDRKLKATWEPPSDCGAFKYEVKINDTVTTTIEKTSYEFLDELHLCDKYTVTITTLYRKERGNSSTKSYEIPITPENIGSVAVLTLTKVNNKLKASWLQPWSWGTCKNFNYEVSLKEIEVRNTTRDCSWYFDVDFRPCSEYNVEVTPYVNDIPGKAHNISHKTETVAENIGPVEELHLNINDENQLIAEWKKPRNLDLCDDVNYEIIVGQNTFHTENNTYIFTDLHMEMCITYEVTVIAEVDTIKGKSEKRQYEMALKYIGPVCNLEVASVGGQLLATWEEPKNLTWCTVTYNITMDEKELITNISETSYTFKEVELRPCQNISIGVHAVVGNIQGQIENYTYSTDVSSEDIGQVENLEVTSRNGKLAAIWTPLFVGNCPVTYGIKIDTDEVEKEIETFFLISELDVEPCTSYTSTVTAFVGNVSGTPQTETYRSAINHVENIYLSEKNKKLVASWNRPLNSDACGDNIQYNVSYRENSKYIETIETAELNFSFDIHSSPCIVMSVDVVPIVDDTEGRCNTGTLAKGIGPVQNLQIRERGTRVTAEWRRPINTEACGDVYYEVIYSEDGINLHNVSTYTTSKSFDLRSASCATIRMSVTPKTDLGINGTSNIQHHIVSISQVSMIDIQEDGGKLQVKWIPPPNSSKCENMKYSVTYIENQKIIGNGKTTNTEMEFSLKSKPCARISMEITPESNGVNGSSNSSSVPIKIGKVQNLGVEELDDKLIVTWNSPLDITLCYIVKFRIVYWEGDTVIHTAEQFGIQTIFDISSKPCTKIRIDVTSINVEDYANFFEGETNTKEHEVSCNRNEQ